jgi:SHAQKYF class myb-like DNA-binding protein
MNQEQEEEEAYQGRWTDAEHELFVVAFHKFGKNWKKISQVVTSRTNIQCRTHAQKLLTGKTARQRPSVPHSRAPMVAFDQPAYTMPSVPQSKAHKVPFDQPGLTVMSPSPFPRVFIGADLKPQVCLEDIVAYLESRVQRVRAAC